MTNEIVEKLLTALNMLEVRGFEYVSSVYTCIVSLEKKKRGEPCTKLDVQNMIYLLENVEISGKKNMSLYIVCIKNLQNVLIKMEEDEHDGDQN